MSPVALILGIVALVAAILAAVFIPLRWRAARRAQAARERFPNARLIVPGANFFGQQSHGVTQMRGNGTLVLTDSELYFERWLLRRDYHIPLSAIQGVETPNSFLGKTVFQPLLKVIFQNEA